MADIFNRTVSFGDAFKSEDVNITFSGISVGMLVQNLNVGYTQQINRIWELGSQNQYYIAGRSGGTFAMAKIAGPAGATGAFIRAYGDVCNAGSNTISFTYGGGWCQGSTAGGLTLNYAVIQNIGFVVAAADVIVNENVSGIYASAQE